MAIFISNTFSLLPPQNDCATVERIGTELMFISDDFDIPKMTFQPSEMPLSSI